ncbi:hypothetical protein ACYX78_08675 [Advenella incenata]
MQNLTLIILIIFVVYVTVLVFIAQRVWHASDMGGAKHPTANAPLISDLTATDRGINSGNIIEEGDRGGADQSAQSAIDLSKCRVNDSIGSSEIQFYVSKLDSILEIRIYYRNSNNAVAAEKFIKIKNPNRGLNSVEHVRNGAKYWYWIAIVYKDNKESSRVPIGVQPDET